MNNNPFFLWGTYIGLVIGLIGSFFIYTTIDVLCEFSACRPTAYILPFIPAILGFIIGRGIYNFPRKSYNKITQENL